MLTTNRQYTGGCTFVCDTGTIELTKLVGYNRYVIIHKGRIASKMYGTYEECLKEFIGQVHNYLGL